MEQVINLIVLLISGYGLSNIIANSDISEIFKERIKNRFIRDMLDCVMCSGFWVGLILSIFVGINPFFGACMVSGFSYFIQNMAEK